MRFIEYGNFEKWGDNMEAIRRIYMVALAIILMAAMATVTTSNVMAQSGSDPSGLTATYNQEHDSVDFTWTPGTNSGYIAQVILGKETGEADWSILSYLDSTTWSSGSISVDRGKSYVFVVAGVVSNSPLTYEGYSNEVTVTIPQGESQQPEPSPTPEPTPEPAPEPVPAPVPAPPPSGEANPSGLSIAYLDGSDTVHFNWTPGTSATCIAQVVLGRQASDTRDAQWTMEGSVESATATSSSLSGVVPGNTYVFKVAGLSSTDPRVYEGYSEEVTFTIPMPESEQPAPVPPPAPAPPPVESEVPSTPPAQPNPSSLSATSAGGSVTLTWVPGTNSKFVKQAIKRREQKRRSRWTTIEVDVAATTYTDTSVQVGKRYIYRVQGLKSNNKGGVTRAVKITVR